MSQTLPEFLDAFVRPLHAGGELKIGAPLGVKDLERWSADAGLLYDDELTRLRLLRATRWFPTPALPEPTLEDLALWMGQYNLLALDHPERERVWARASTWEMAVTATRALIHRAAPTDASEQLARHVSVDAFLALRRSDQIARVGEQSRRYPGQAAPRSVRRMASIGEIELLEERVDWIDAAKSGASSRLLQDLSWVSPLTALMNPSFAHPGFDPRMPATWLRNSSGARAVVHSWARVEDWVGTGASLMRSLLEALGREELVSDEPVARGRGAEAELEATGASEDDEASHELGMLPAVESYGPAEQAALLGALVHLHFLKVMAFEARVTLGGRKSRAAARAFLALPLLLSRFEGRLGDPLLGVEDPDALRRWDDYLGHLRGLVPLDVLENLVAALVDPVVQGGAP